MMKFGIQFRQGDIILVPFPFTDLSTAKQRPALIISKNNYNSKTDDIIICGITSNLKDSNYSVLIANSDLSSGNLITPSRVKLDKIFTLNKSKVIRKFGAVREEVISKIKLELNNMF